MVLSVTSEIHTDTDTDVVNDTGSWSVKGWRMQCYIHLYMTSEGCNRGNIKSTGFVVTCSITYVYLFMFIHVLFQCLSSTNYDKVQSGLNLCILTGDVQVKMSTVQCFILQSCIVWWCNQVNNILHGLAWFLLVPCNTDGLFFSAFLVSHELLSKIFKWNTYKCLEYNREAIYCAEMCRCRRACWPKTLFCLYDSGQNSIFPCISSLHTVCNWTGQLSKEWNSRDLLAVIRRCLVQIPCGVDQSGPKWELLSDLSSTDAPENDGSRVKLSLWVNAPSCK